MPLLTVLPNPERNDEYDGIPLCALETVKYTNTKGKKEYHFMLCKARVLKKNDIGRNLA